MSAELAARRIAAAAVQADYRRDALDALSAGQEPDWASRTHWLAIALDSILNAGPGPALTTQQLAVIGQALADAVTYRDPSGQCTACEAEYGGLCYDHAGDLGQSDAYLALGRELGIEVAR